MTNKKHRGVKTEAYSKLKVFVTSRKYVSLRQINSFLKELGYNYSRETIQKYIRQLKKEKVLYSAGRGFYSTNQNQFTINPAEFQDLIDLIKKRYSLLEFSLWSTKMLTPLFHHMQNQFYTFIYADINSLPYLRDLLTEKNFRVYLNPSKNDIKKNPLLINSIILRSLIERGRSENNIASIEKILVDFFMENKRINLIDQSEYEKIFSNILNNYLINFSNLLDYAQRRKNREEFQNLITKCTNVTFV
jgi:biotin operon repressor